MQIKIIIKITQIGVSLQSPAYHESPRPQPRPRTSSSPHLKNSTLRPLPIERDSQGIKIFHGRGYEAHVEPTEMLGPTPIGLPKSQIPITFSANHFFVMGGNSTIP